MREASAVNQQRPPAPKPGLADRFRAILSAVPAQARDQLGEIRGTHQLARPDKQDKALNRLLLIALCFCLAVIAAQQFHTASLYPLVRYVPYLIEYDKAERVMVTARPIPLESEGRQFAAEDFVRRYVAARNTITRDYDLVAQLWGDGGIIQRVSVGEVFEAFKRDWMMNLPSLKDKGVTRQIRFESVTHLPVGNDVWQVDYVTVDRDKFDRVIVTLRWSVTLRIASTPQLTSFDDRFLNPLGFTVQSYTLAQRG